MIFVLWALLIPSWDVINPRCLVAVDADVVKIPHVLMAVSSNQGYKLERSSLALMNVSVWWEKWMYINQNTDQYM